jgi:hypothetical protein
MDEFRNEMKISLAAVETKVDGRVPSFHKCVRDIVSNIFTLYIILDVQQSITRVEKHVVDAKADDAQTRGRWFLVSTVTCPLASRSTAAGDYKSYITVWTDDCI